MYLPLACRLSLTLSYAAPGLCACLLFDLPQYFAPSALALVFALIWPLLCSALVCHVFSHFNGSFEIEVAVIIVASTSCRKPPH